MGHVTMATSYFSGGLSSIGWTCYYVPNLKSIAPPVMKTGKVDNEGVWVITSHRRSLKIASFDTARMSFY